MLVQLKIRAEALSTGAVISNNPSQTLYIKDWWRKLRAETTTDIYTTLLAQNVLIEDESHD